MYQFVLPPDPRCHGNGHYDRRLWDLVGKCHRPEAALTPTLTPTPIYQMKLRGKVALVTGAAQGLGRGFTESMLQLGAKVALLDIKVLDGRKTTKELGLKYGQDKVLFLPCDVTDKGQMESAFQQVLRHFGQLDVVVNNAGVTEQENWELVLDINLRSVIQGTYLGLHHMSRERGGGGGLIINIASMAGLIAMFHGPVYTATKHGVVGLSRSLGIRPQIFRAALSTRTPRAGVGTTTPFHFDRTGVRVCALCPTMTDTPIQPPRVASTPEEQVKLDAHWAYTDSQGGLLKISEVVAGFLQLVEDDSKNGAVMRVTKQKGVDYQPYGGGGQGVPVTTPYLGQMPTWSRQRR
ncbi:hypothetical protein Bbelb_415740 [Branchiostoma belcheri]|nr:hypothetical protein Bbelb_415740 [Branchiostoma belcheri]